jgi:hypothetical protein
MRDESGMRATAKMPLNAARESDLEVRAYGRGGGLGRGRGVGITLGIAK